MLCVIFCFVVYKYNSLNNPIEQNIFSFVHMFLYLNVCIQDGPLIHTFAKISHTQICLRLFKKLLCKQLCFCMVFLFTSCKERHRTLLKQPFLSEQRGIKCPFICLRALLILKGPWNCFFNSDILFVAQRFFANLIFNSNIFPTLVIIFHLNSLLFVVYRSTSKEI